MLANVVLSIAIDCCDSKDNNKILMKIFCLMFWKAVMLLILLREFRALFLIKFLNTIAFLIFFHSWGRYLLWNYYSLDGALYWYGCAVIVAALIKYRINTFMNNHRDKCLTEQKNHITVCLETPYKDLTQKMYIFLRTFNNFQSNIVKLLLCVFYTFRAWVTWKRCRSICFG